MSTGAIEFISVGMQINEIAGSKPEGVSNSFSDWLAKEMGAVNMQLNNAELQVQQLAAGDEGNLHQVMLALEKAQLELELTVQIRNKLLEGYQDIMRMQV